MMTDGRLVVFKLGGSLLSLPDLPQRLGAVLTQTQCEHPLMVGGGGEAAELIRQWQPLHSLTDEAAHWLAVRAMSLNAALLLELIPRAVIVSNITEMNSAWHARRLPILSAERFLRAEEETAEYTLPHDWSATSDSIAAWVAQRLGGRALTLLKSVDLPADISLTEAAKRGLVDAHFPHVAEPLAVSWGNVQANALQTIKWTTGTTASD